MKKFVAVVLLLHVLALHSSIAGMEILAWITALLSVGLLASDKDLRQRFLQGVNLKIIGFLFALTLWAGISLLWNPELEPRLEQFGMMRWALLLPLLTVALRSSWSPQFEDRLLKVWVAAFAIVGVYAIVQFLTGFQFHSDRTIVDPQGAGLYKAVGFFSMSLSFAYVFGQSAFVARAALQKWNIKIVWPLVVIAALGILGSMSRGAWVAASICLVVYIYQRHGKWFWPAMVALILTVGVLVQVPGGIGKKLHDMLTLNVDHSSSVRMNLWRAYFEMFADHPVQGVGISQGDRLLPEYYQRLGIQETFQSHAHNNYLQWLAGTGAVGFFFYIAIAAFFLGLAGSLRERSNWGWGLYLAQLFFHIGGFTEANFFDGEANHMIIFIWALTWALYLALDQRALDRRFVADRRGH